jgi:AraC-like DNA-binding protein
MSEHIRSRRECKEPAVNSARSVPLAGDSTRSAVVQLPQSTSLVCASGTVVHARLPPHEATGFTSVSEPFAFGVSYTGHRKTVIASDGERSITRSFGPGAVGLNGVRPLSWLRVVEPSEGLEIHPAPSVLSEVSDITGYGWAGHDHYLQTETDAVIWGACARFRLAVLDVVDLSELEAESIIYHVVLHAAVHHFGGRRPRVSKGRLDARRLERVRAYLHANMHRVVSLAELSSVAAMSAYHLQRLFKRSTALSPAQYAMALRMERAHRLLGEGKSRRQAANEVGFRDAAHFRRCYRRFFGSVR